MEHHGRDRLASAMAFADLEPVRDGALRQRVPREAVAVHAHAAQPPRGDVVAAAHVEFPQVGFEPLCEAGPVGHHFEGH